MKYHILNKYLAAFTGLFLLLFLTGHLAGNLQLLLPHSGGAQDQFNQYAYFMQNNPLVKALSYITYSAILLHILVTLKLVINSKSARPIKYKIVKSSAEVSSSKYMGILGTIILGFLVIHLSDFWYKAHFEDVKDLYTLVINKFSNIWYVLLYVFSMGAIFLHVLHGFQSSIQSLGLMNSRIKKYVKILGMLYALLIPTLFALIPILIYFRQFV